MKRGFTLIEILIVLTIVVILAALIQPAFSETKKQAQVQASVLRLKQLYQTVEVYRTDYDLANYTIESYPPFGTIYSTYLGLGKDFFKSPCGYKQGIEDNQKKLSYQYVPYPGSVTEDHFRTYQQNSLIFRDPHCNTPLQWNSAYMTKKKLGILANGRTVNEMAIGITTRLEWWLPSDVRENVIEK